MTEQSVFIKIRLITLNFLYSFYRAVRPLLGPKGCCRFTPTCSMYAYQAVRKYGFFKGGWLAVKRLSRCHPFGGHGHDPVP